MSLNYKNDGFRYTYAANHTAHDSTEVAVDDIKALKATDNTGPVVYTLNGSDVTDYFIQGMIYPIGGNLTLIKATGSTPTTFVVYR